MGHTTTTANTPALALAYFIGYSDGEASATLRGLASTTEVVRSFADEVARRRVARDAFAAYQSGWRTAEAMGV